MDLFDRLPAEHRTRLDAASETFKLGHGELLLRRGERGGDIYRLLEGELEVVDSRVEPPVVIDRLGPGAVVGEMAFIDEAVRSADVRAAEESICQHWSRPRLKALLDEDALLGSSFHLALAQVVNARSRGFRALAMSDGLGKGAARSGRPSTGLALSAALAEAEAELLDSLRLQLRESEPKARNDPDGTRPDVHDALDAFDVGMTALLGRMSTDQRSEALDRIGLELHPYLIRSQLAELAMDRPSGRSEDPEAMAHLMADAPEGDGAIGGFIDQWLLQRPTAVGLRERQLFVVNGVPELMDSHRLLLVNCGASGLDRRLAAVLPSTTPMTLVEHDRERLDPSLITDHGEVDLRRLRHEDLAAVALGERSLRLPESGVVIVDGMADYLPDRALATLLTQLFNCCADGAWLWLPALQPSTDALIFGRLLRWPMVRRAPEALTGIVERAGFTHVELTTTGGAGLVLRARAGLR